MAGNKESLKQVTLFTPKSVQGSLETERHRPWLSWTLALTCLLILLRPLSAQQAQPYRGDMFMAGIAGVQPMGRRSADAFYFDDYMTFMNPFFQPNDSSLAWYGSGDVDSNNVIDWEDYNAMQSGVQNDMADVDGDGTPSTSQDMQLLSDYLNSSIDYLPGHWNYLQTRAERDSWIEKMMAITGTDTIDYDYPPYPDAFISGNFASLLAMEFWDYREHTDGNPNDTLWAGYYPYESGIGRFNLPVYIVAVKFPNTGIGHGMNAILTGDNPLDWNDWNALEPQTDETNVQPGGWNIRYGSKFKIYGPREFNGPFGGHYTMIRLYLIS